MKLRSNMGLATTDGESKRGTPTRSYHRLSRRNRLHAAAAQSPHWAVTITRPQQIVSRRRDRLSVIVNLSVSPRRWLMRPAFRIRDHNILTADVVRHLRALQRQHRRPLIVVLDRLNVHKAAVKRLHARGAVWLHEEWLPPYAPVSILSKRCGAKPSTPPRPTSCRTIGAIFTTL